MSIDPVQNRALQSTEHNYSSECSICLENLRLDQMVAIAAVVGCNHVFHRSCISDWQVVQKEKEEEAQSCPECRGPLALYTPLFLTPTDRALVSIWKKIKSSEAAKGTFTPEYTVPSIREWMRDHEKNLENITQLDLSNAKLCGALPDEMEYFSNLRKLNLTGNGFRSFPKVLEKLPFLQELEIEPEVLEGEDARIVQEKIQSNKTLTIIWEWIKKANPKLGVSACNPNEIRKLLQDPEVIEQVTRLDLRDCSFENSLMVMLENARLRFLKTVILSCEQCDFLLKCTECFPALQELQIEGIIFPFSLFTRAAALESRKVDSLVIKMILSY